MSIKVQNVTKTYGKQKALDNVSFEIQKGEIVGFLGPNGAGKSTMMKIITCFLPQTAGSVEVCGFDVVEKDFAVKKIVGYLPEHNPLYLDMYVKEYLMFVGKVHSVKNVSNKVDEMIQLVGLQKEQSKMISALSKGYRQRVGLAQAMIHNPEVLILDEPTSGLDPNQIVEIRNLIKDIGKEKTVMMSTHIMQEVEAICDRVIIINNGKLVADDTAKEIKHSKGEEIVISIEFSVEVPIKELKELSQVKEALKQEGSNYHVVQKGSEDVRNALFQYAVSKNITVLDMHKEEKSMEDIFKSLTS